MNFKKLCIDAYEECKAAEAERTAEQLEKDTISTTRKFLELISSKHLPDGVIVTGNWVEITGPDAIRLQYRNREGTWHVMGRCPKCGKDVLSIDCLGLPDIGGQLVDFQPDFRHFGCNGQKPQESTWQDILAEALAIGLGEIQG
jgi:hypothetical protein